MPLRDVHNYKGHELGTREDGKIVVAAYDREFPTMEAAHAWVDQHVKDEAQKSSAPFSVLDLVKGTAAHRSAFNLSKGAKPPAGYTPIPGGKKGGYRKRKGAGWDYWYPDGGGTQSQPQNHQIGHWRQTNSSMGTRYMGTTDHGHYDIIERPTGHVVHYVQGHTTSPIVLDSRGKHVASRFEQERHGRLSLPAAKKLANDHHNSVMGQQQQAAAAPKETKVEQPSKGAQYLSRSDFREATKDYTAEDHAAASAEHTSLAEAHSKTAKTLDDAGKRGSRQHHEAADYHTKLADAHKRHVEGGINEAMKPIRRMKDIAAQSAKRAKDSRHFIGTQKSDNPLSPISGGYRPSIMSQYGQEN